jgi:hypothetical protein
MKGHQKNTNVAGGDRPRGPSRAKRDGHNTLSAAIRSVWYADSDFNYSSVRMMTGAEHRI